MTGTSYRGSIRRLVFHCVRRTQRGPRSRCCALPGSTHKQGAGRPFINGHPTLQCHRPAVYIQRLDGRWLRNT
ncbi:unnamed protein product, partial [Staurois parvus]